MVLVMAPLHSLGHNDQNEVKHGFFSHVMLTASSMAQFFSLGKDN